MHINIFSTIFVNFIYANEHVTNYDNSKLKASQIYQRHIYQLGDVVVVGVEEKINNLISHLVGYIQKFWV